MVATLAEKDSARVDALIEQYPKMTDLAKECGKILKEDYVMNYLNVKSLAVARGIPVKQYLSTYLPKSYSNYTMISVVATLAEKDATR